MTALPLFYRLIVRPLRQERLRTTLAVLAVALGVAAVLAIELAGQAAAGSFQSSLQTLTGTSNLEVSASGGVPAEVFARLSGLPYPLKLHARIEDYGVLDGVVRRAVPIIGIDLISEGAVEKSVREGETRAFSDPELNDAVWLSSDLGYKSGDRVRLLINDTASDFTVRRSVERSGGRCGPDGSRASHAVATARRKVGPHPDRSPTVALHRRLGDAASPEPPSWRRHRAAGRANRRKPPHVGVIPLESSRPQLCFPRGRRVPHLQHDFGIDRAAAVRNRHFAGAGHVPRGNSCGISGRGRCFGLLGGMVGIVLGRVMSEGAVKLVASTVSSLYFSSQPAPISLTWKIALLGIAIGVGISLISALGARLGSLPRSPSGSDGEGPART